MAGDISIPQTLTATLLGEIVACGLTLEIKVDCSHNAYIPTIRPDRPGTIMAKAIETDAALKSMDAKALGSAITRLQAARPGKDGVEPSPENELFQFYAPLKQRMDALSSPVTLGTLTQNDLKIEFPNFDATILYLNAPPASIANAIAACSARTAAAFNALPPYVRRSMEMYDRTDANEFKLSGPQEPQPRTAPTDA